MELLAVEITVGVARLPRDQSARLWTSCFDFRDHSSPYILRDSSDNTAKMGHNSDKMYVTHSEHASGSHSASSTGKRMEVGKSEFQRLPL